VYDAVVSLKKNVANIIMQLGESLCMICGTYIHNVGFKIIRKVHFGWDLRVKKPGKSA